MRKGEIIIFETFEALDAKKRERILTAAYGEFGRYGYKKTAVEQIAKSAGIAKGMVFHYFHTKKELFEYLCAYAKGIIHANYHLDVNKVKKIDYLEFYRDLTKIKLTIYRSNPSLVIFLSMLYMHPENQNVSPQVKQIYDDILEFRYQSVSLMSTYCDNSKFRGDIDLTMAKKYILWIIDGYADELVAGFGDEALCDINLDPYWDEFDIILDDLKKLFYV